MWSIHTTEYYTNLRRKEILTQGATWMNLEDIMLGEICQSQKGKYYDSISMRFLEIPRDRKWNGSCQGLRGGGVMRSWSLMGTEIWFIR